MLEAWLPTLGLGSAATGTDELPAGTDDVRGVRTRPIRVSITSLADAPADSADAYLRLQLLSHRIVRPHETNLDGIFGVLVNVAWTSSGPVAADQVEEVRLR